MDNSTIVAQINSIIQDIGDDKPITLILRRAQIIAANLGNEEFRNWIHNEQYGYPNAYALPDYRILDCKIVVDYSIPYKGLANNVSIPADVFDDKVIRKALAKVKIINSLMEIETLIGSKPAALLAKELPGSTFSYLSQFVNGDVINARQTFTAASTRTVIELFKSKLLDFFIELNGTLEGGLDFAQLQKSNTVSQIMNTYNITSGAVNMGNGTMTVDKISDNTISQTINSDSQAKLDEILSSISDLTSSLQDPDFQEALAEIKRENSQPQPKKSRLKLMFNGLKTLAMGVANEVATNQIVALIERGIGVL